MVPKFADPDSAGVRSSAAIKRFVHAVGLKIRLRPLFYHRKGNRAYDDETRLAGLTPEQQGTVHTMETFHWRLEFVRRPLFRFPIPVMFNQAGDRFVVIRDDGTIDEEPDLKLRD